VSPDSITEKYDLFISSGRIDIFSGNTMVYKRLSSEVYTRKEPIGWKACYFLHRRIK